MTLTIVVFIALAFVVALIAAAVMTGGRLWSILIIPVAAWPLVLALNLSWWVLICAFIAAAILVVWTRFERPIIAVIAVIAILIGAYVGFFGSDESRLAAAFAQQLEENNEKFTFDETCAKPEHDPICDALKLQQDRIDGLVKRVTKNEGRLDQIDVAFETLTGKVGEIEENLEVVEIVTPDQTIIKSDGGDTDDAAGKALAKELAPVGWGPGKVSINNVDEDLYTEQGTGNRFRDRVRTLTGLVEYLNGTSTAEVANRNTVLSSVPEDQHERLLRGDGWFSIQFLEEMCLSGNTFFKDGTVRFNGEQCFDKGDVLWVYVGTDNKVYWGATVRDVCGNAHIDAAPRPKSRKPAPVQAPAPGPSRPSSSTSPTTAPPATTPEDEPSTPATPEPTTPTPEPSTPTEPEPSTPTTPEPSTPTCGVNKECESAPEEPDEYPAPAPSPVSSRESVAPVEPDPADPSEEPAPGATQAPAPIAPPPPAEVAPEPSASHSGDEDPGR